MTPRNNGINILQSVHILLGITNSTHPASNGELTDKVVTTKPTNRNVMAVDMLVT